MQRVVLRLENDFDVVTDDSPPVALGRLSRDLVESQFAHAPRQGTLLRFEIGNGGISFLSETPAGDGDGTGFGLERTKLAAVDLRLVGKANPRRPGADFISKILFQYLLRNGRNPVSIDTLRRAAQLAPCATPTVDCSDFCDVDGTDEMSDADEVGCSADAWEVREMASASIGYG